MTCPQCQYQNPDDAAYCGSCGLAFATGESYTPLGSFQAKPKQGLATASMVLGILSIPLMFVCGIGLVTGITGIVLGIVALVKASKAPAEYAGTGMAVTGLVLGGLTLVFIPIAAAIAIPSLLRARVSANEAATIGDVRAVISAQMAYASANGGLYDTLDCLSGPTRCIPGYSETAPTFLDPALASATTKSGYSRTLHLGPSPDPSEVARQVSPSSRTSFAYVAVPATKGQTGVRGFCGDSSGRICYTTDGSAPPVADGLCAETCTPLR